MLGYHLPMHDFRLIPFSRSASRRAALSVFAGAVA
jgi:hypothetical protein